MNDLDFGGDLRTALHRDAALVGEPPMDLLDQLLRRRRQQRRQRTALVGAIAAVVLVAAGIPVGVSLAARSAPAPATQPATPTPSDSQETAPTPTATSGASAATTTPPIGAATPTTPTAPAPIVTAWARKALHGLSFVVPASQAKIEITDLYPTGGAIYNWNIPMAVGVPHLTVSVSATELFPPGVHGGQDPSDGSQPITVRGCSSANIMITSARIMTTPVFDEDGQTRTQVECTTGSTFYSVVMVAPDTPEGAAAVQTMVDSLRIVTDPPCDWTAMDAALPADTADRTYKLVLGDGALCDGTWAAAGYTEVNYVDGVAYPDGQAAIFHYVAGAWVWLDRYSDSAVCDNPDIPHDVWERGCGVD